MSLQIICWVGPPCYSESDLRLASINWERFVRNAEVGYQKYIYIYFVCRPLENHMNQTFPHVAVGKAFIGCTIVSRSILQTFLPSRFDSMLKVVTPHEIWILSRKKQLPGASKGVQATEIAALRNRGGANEKECEDLTDFVGIFVLGGPTVIVSTNCTRPNSQIPRHFLIIAMLKPHFSQGGRSRC